MKFKAWCPDRGETIDDAKTIEAGDSQTAAEKWAEQSDWNSAEFSIVSGTDVVVVVELVSFPPVRFTYRVRGESVPIYTAEELP